MFGNDSFTSIYSTEYRVYTYVRTGVVTYMCVFGTTYATKLLPHPFFSRKGYAGEISHTGRSTVRVGP